LLSGKPGIVSVNVLEGSPDLLVLLEAPEKQEAAHHLMDLMNSMEGMVEDVRILPVRETAAKLVVPGTGIRGGGSARARSHLS
jgi:hypothetical protein